MEKNIGCLVMKILLLPLRVIYCALLLLSFPVEGILHIFGIKPGLRNELLNILRSDNIKKQYVYAMLRMINVILLFYFAYTVGRTRPESISSLKQPVITLVLCIAGVLILHFTKKHAFKKMGITPFREIKAKDMDGVGFEQYCAELLRANGYKNVKLTKASGDQGVDILAEYKKETYAIQCKYYSTPLGNKPIQEVYAGKTFYECDRAIVMTNNKFTKGAQELAESVDVKLWASIPVMESGRGLVYFWYAVDIIFMLGCSLFIKQNIDNTASIIMVGVMIAYVVLFAVICAGFLKE